MGARHSPRRQIRPSVTTSAEFNGVLARSGGDAERCNNWMTFALDGDSDDNAGVDDGCFDHMAADMVG